MHLVILTELGILVMEDKKCVKTFAFSDPSEDYVSIKHKEWSVENLAKFLTELGGESEVLVSDESLMNLLKTKSIEARLMSEQEIDNIQSTKTQILIDAGLASDVNDAMSKLRNFAVSLSSSKIAKVSQSPDLHLIQAINTLDETDKIINAISARIREWYGLHFPELDNIIDSIKGYSQIVLAGKRQDLVRQVYENAGFPDSKVEMLCLVGEKSRGGDISDENLAIVQTLAKQILELYELRRNIEEHIEKQMNQVAPNLTAILGAAVGARILARAGNLKKLSSMPASTIQVLGAEKALFRSLKTGTRPPKHGLLFQHALVHAAPRWQRGKLARAIAAKAAIASRVDVYGAQLNETLLEKLNLRVVEISKKYKEPVPRQQQPDFKTNQMQEYTKRGKKGSKSRRAEDKQKKKKRKKFGRRR